MCDTSFQMVMSPTREMYMKKCAKFSSKIHGTKVVFLLQKKYHNNVSHHKVLNKADSCIRNVIMFTL